MYTYIHIYFFFFFVAASSRRTLSVTVPHAKTGTGSTHRATACTRNTARKKKAKANMTSVAKLTEATSSKGAAPEHLEEEEGKR